MIFRPATSTHNHLISEHLGDQPASVQDRLSWTNVARPCCLLGIDPSSAKFGIISLSTNTSAMGLLEEDDKGLGLIGQALDHVSLAGSGPFNVQLEHHWLQVLC